MAESKLQRYHKLLGQLALERASWESHWREVAEHILPRRIRLDNSTRNRGEKVNAKILNGTATKALRTMRSGLQSGITSPARPWFKMSTGDTELDEYNPVKVWLETVTDMIAAEFARSNLYTQLPNVYSDLGAFGTAAFLLEESESNDPSVPLLRAYSFPIGSYYLGLDAQLRPATFARKFTMTVRQIMEKHGRPEKSHDGEPAHQDKVSPKVRAAWESGQYETPIDVVHIITPNYEYDERYAALNGKHRKFASCLYEVGQESQFLEESGFHEFPVIAPRWDVTGEDVYGTSPGMDALGDVKSLQNLERKSAQAVDKMLNPPLMGPSALRSQKVSLISGDITYVDVREGMGGLKPVHEVRFDLAAADTRVARCEERIRSAFFEDLFLMIANEDRSGVTATEIAARQQEKLLALGPVLERLNDEGLDPMVERTFNVMDRRGMFPPRPEQLLNAKIKPEYTSIMAQAQKLAGIGNVERFVGFIGSLSEAHPEVGDVPDWARIVRGYADMVGVPASDLHSEEDVKAMQDQRAQAQQQAQRTAMLEQAASGAKLLSETDTSRPSALTAMLGA